MNDAIALLMQARDNGGGLELHDVFGPNAEDMATMEQILPAVQDQLALQWCFQEPALLETQRDDTLVPPVWFLLTAAGEALTNLQDVPAELVGNGDFAMAS